MRLAVISDVHNNLAALEAVVADLRVVSPDSILIAGDFLNRGPQPREVLQLVRSLGWPLLRGNHEDYVLAQCCDIAGDDPLANPIWQPARWTAQQISKPVDDIGALPIATTLTGPDDSRVLVAHGRPDVNNNGVFGRTTDDELRQMLSAQPPDLFLCAHTHVPLVRHIDTTLIMNVGAVGLPFNGDPRAQYGIATWRNREWHAELRAVEYDRQATLDAFKTNNFFEGGGPLARVIMREVETARPHLGPWVRHFGDDVRAGYLSVGEAVDRYFQELAS
jgi:predicted phosphodiesterase